MKSDSRFVLPKVLHLAQNELLEKPVKMDLEQTQVTA